MKIDNIVKEFNKYHATKSKLVSASKKTIVIEMKGKSEAGIEKDMHALRTRLEEILNDSVLIQSIRKSGSTFTVKFSIEKSPAEDILKVLKRYDDGTMPRDGGFED